MKNQPVRQNKVLSNTFAKRFYNLQEAGAYLGLSAWTIRDFVHSGKLRQVRVPHPFKKGKFLARPILIDIKNLEEFANEIQQNG